MGSFLLTGPSGVGKTSMAQSLAEQLGYAFLRFDMSEFIEPHSIARLIGSPPGYVGYNDGAAGGGALINALENTPSCVLLIDEVEKAHPDVLNIFLQAMDRGEITSQNQKTVSLRNVFLIFTSNLGATVMEKHTLGFGAGVNSDREAESFAAVKRFFAPEFRNRLDAVISFSPLGKTVMRDIVDKFVVELNKLALVKNVQVMIDTAASDWLADQGYDSSLGARPLSRVIDTNIKKPMSREILFGSLVNGGTVDVTVDQDTNKLKLEYKALMNE
jgi:ATP-dependent Clp protease ATP-binding subunit ClpA